MTLTVTDKEIEKAVDLYVEELLTSFSNTESDHVFSERYEKRKAQIIACGAKPVRRADSSENRVIRPVWLRRSIAAVLTLVLSLSIAMTFSTTARAAVSNWLTETYNKLVKYVFSHNEDDHTYLICAPGSLPEGFEHVETIREDNYTLKEYKNAVTGDFLRFEYSKATEPMKAEIEKQKAGAELLAVSGSIEKYCFDAGASRRVFWYDHQRELVFFADSSLDRDILAASLDSISIRLPLYEPAWLPEGYEEAEQNTEYPSVMITYMDSNSKGMIIYCYSDMAETDLVAIDQIGKDLDFETVQINGIRAYYYSYKDEEGGDLIWIDEETKLVFTISTSVSRDELLLFANSIKCVELDW